MLRRGVLGIVLVLLMVLFGLTPAAVAAPQAPTCPEGQVWVRTRCAIIVVPEGPPPSAAQPRGGSGEKLTARTCTFEGAAIECSTHLGEWDSGRTCYVGPLTPQPALGDPLWRGHTDGVVLACTHPTNRLNVYTFWAPSAASSVDVEEVARQLRASMEFTPVEIGIVPEPGPDRMGLIGLPTWLWVQNPGATTLGPQTRSLSAGGVTVTLTAEVTSTRWEMGDGGVVTCTTAGTPYEDRHGISPSPTCGHLYSEQGDYTVTALTNWQATWRASNGDQGVFTWQVGSSTSIRMGEAQVLNQ